ncbi:MAG: histidinol dehydrogenase [Bacteroidota bacterium]
MKIYSYTSNADWETILKRPALDSSKLESIVSEVLARVKQEGDAALKEYTAKFDGVQLQLENLQVSEEEIIEAKKQVSLDLQEAIQTAHQNIKTFHEQQQTAPQIIETMPGIQCWRKSVGIEKVGLYIPGGTAPLFSTILMLGVPAKIAGCREIVLCTPPQKDGSVHPAILYTANLVGITKIFKIGGSQAVAAMAYGTESVPQVYKIFGPGNQYVTAAKQLVNKEGIAIDMPAGPSEVLVGADESAEPAFVAADLLSQAEHGVDSQVVLVAFSEDFVTKVQAAIQEQLQNLPRKVMAEKALENSVVVIVENREQALDLINFYAPEHLILAVEKVEEFAEGIINAGSVFMGNYTPESVGDYASGTNHTLPTNGFARAYSGVSLDSFVKKITFQQLTKEGLQNIASSVETMAAEEQLEAHRKAVAIRLDR